MKPRYRWIAKWNRWVIRIDSLPATYIPGMYPVTLR